MTEGFLDADVRRVLDLCCGAGASAIPAAQAVGPTGRVLAVDVAEPLLETARTRAERQGTRDHDLGPRDCSSGRASPVRRLRFPRPSTD
jgi:methylase of polypeptide subunit release factors